MNVPYYGRVALAVKPPDACFATAAPDRGSPSTELLITTGPDGSILSVKQTRESSSKAWDDCVLRSVAKKGKLPLDEHGRIPPQLRLSFNR